MVTQCKNALLTGDIHCYSWIFKPCEATGVHGMTLLQWCSTARTVMQKSDTPCVLHQSLSFTLLAPYLRTRHHNLSHCFMNCILSFFCRECLGIQRWARHIWTFECLNFPREVHMFTFSNIRICWAPLSGRMLFATEIKNERDERNWQITKKNEIKRITKTWTRKVGVEWWLLLLSFFGVGVASPRSFGCCCFPSLPFGWCSLPILLGWCCVHSSPLWVVLLRVVLRSKHSLVWYFSTSAVLLSRPSLLVVLLLPSPGSSSSSPWGGAAFPSSFLLCGVVFLSLLGAVLPFPFFRIWVLSG